MFCRRPIYNYVKTFIVIFVMMATKTLKKITPKGERLGWTPLKEVKPVVITAELMKTGRVVVGNDRNDEASANNSFLIP